MMYETAPDDQIASWSNVSATTRGNRLFVKKRVRKMAENAFAAKPIGQNAMKLGLFCTIHMFKTYFPLVEPKYI